MYTGSLVYIVHNQVVIAMQLSSYTTKKMPTCNTESKQEVVCPNKRLFVYNGQTPLVLNSFIIVRQPLSLLAIVVYFTNLCSVKVGLRLIRD